MKSLLFCMVVAVSCAGCEDMTTQPAGGRSVIAFSASYCSSCVTAKAEIARLQAAGAQVRVVDCATPAGKAITVSHKITELPTYILLVGGKEVERTHDVYTIRQWIGR